MHTELRVPPDSQDVDGDAAIEFEPFPMGDLPSACVPPQVFLVCACLLRQLTGWVGVCCRYWVGRMQSKLALGGTACHIMFEFEERHHDVARLERALQLVINRHKMLRCIITEDGMNQVLRSVPPYKIATIDGYGKSDAELKAIRDAEWARMMHRVFDSSQWPLFEVKMIVSDTKHWILADFDHLTMDLRSMFIVFQEWNEVYAGRGDTLAPVPRFTYRMAMERVLDQRNTPRHQADKEYWFSRIDDFPAAPTLPLARELSSVQAPTFRRLQQYV